MKDNEVTKEDDAVLFQKVSFYLKNAKPVHITLKNNRWMRGYIREGGAEYFILDEFKLGEQTLFFSECIAINDYKPLEGQHG